MLPARMLLDLLKAPDLCMVCYGNVSSMRHIYGKSFDNTRQHIFLKTDARKPRSQWSITRIYARDTIFLYLMAVVKVRNAP